MGIINGASSSEFGPPQSRNEAILLAMLDKLNGNEPGELPAPQSRVETLLQEVLANLNAVVISYVEGATPVIVAEDNYCYICEEVTSISITPPASGICDVIFTSGSTPTALTLPAAVTTPEWFDRNDLEPNTIYEIMITDGTYGVVMTWQA